MVFSENIDDLNLSKIDTTTDNNDCIDQSMYPFSENIDDLDLSKLDTTTDNNDYIDQFIYPFSENLDDLDLSNIDTTTDNNDCIDQSIFEIKKQNLIQLNQLKFVGDIEQYKFNITKLDENKTDEDILTNLMSSNSFEANDCFYGMTSKQNLTKHGFPKKYKHLVNNYLEYNLFNINNMNSILDAITDIEFSMDNINPINQFKAEIVLKINGYVICSSSCEFGKKIKLIENPNFIIYYLDTKPQINISIRINFNASLQPNMIFNLSYNPLFFSNKCRQKIMSSRHYCFKTISGIKILSMSGLYVVRKFSDLYDSVDNEFKFLYGDKLANL